MNFSEYVTIFSLEPPAFIVPNSKKPPPIALLKLLFQLNDCNIKSPISVVGLFNLQLGR